MVKKAIAFNVCKLYYFKFTSMTQKYSFLKVQKTSHFIIILLLDILLKKIGTHCSLTEYRVLQ